MLGWRKERKRASWHHTGISTVIKPLYDRKLWLPSFSRDIIANHELKFTYFALTPYSSRNCTCLYCSCTLEISILFIFSWYMICTSAKTGGSQKVPLSKQNLPRNITGRWQKMQLFSPLKISSVIRLFYYLETLHASQISKQWMK